MWQAEHVRDRLRALYPDCDVRIEGMTTEGDRILDRALYEIGGKALFVKELEQALLDGRADLAVHSLKDVPMLLPPPFALAAIMSREDPRDAFVSNRYAGLDEMPDGTVLGTSSLRRAAQARARRPGLVVRALRGNVNTRLRRLDDGEYDAILLAVAGLTRLGLGERVRQFVEPDVCLPAAGQGALGIEIRADRDDLARWLRPLADPATTAQVRAERAVSRELGGSCRVPLAAYCLPRGEGLWLRARVAAEDGHVVLEAEAASTEATVEAAERIGLEVAAALRAQGAEQWLGSS